MAAFTGKNAVVSRALGLPVDFDVRGRSIVYLIYKLSVFWGRHKATLLPYIQDAAISAALDTLANLIVEVVAINPPGPD